MACIGRPVPRAEAPAPFGPREVSSARPAAPSGPALPRIKAYGAVVALIPLAATPASVEGTPVGPPELLRASQARIGVAAACASSRTGPLTSSGALPCALRPRECGVVLVGARIAAWATAILAATTPEPRPVACAATRALRVSIRGHVGPKP